MITKDLLEKMDKMYDGNARLILYTDFSGHLEIKPKGFNEWSQEFTFDNVKELEDYLERQVNG